MRPWRACALRESCNHAFSMPGPGGI